MLASFTAAAGKLKLYCCHCWARVASVDMMVHSCALNTQRVQMHTLGIKLQIAQTNIMQTVSVVASGRDSFRLALDIETDPSHSGPVVQDVSGKHYPACPNRLVLKCKAVSCKNCKFSISITAGRQWWILVYWCIWCSQLCSVFSSVTTLHGKHHVYSKIPSCPLSLTQGQPSMLAAHLIIWQAKPMQLENALLCG